MTASGRRRIQAIYRRKRMRQAGPRHGFSLELVVAALIVGLILVAIYASGGPS